MMTVNNRKMKTAAEEYEFLQDVFKEFQVNPIKQAAIMSSFVIYGKPSANTLGCIIDDKTHLGLETPQEKMEYMERLQFVLKNDYEYQNSLTSGQIKLYLNMNLSVEQAKVIHDCSMNVYGEYNQNYVINIILKNITPDMSCEDIQIIGSSVVQIQILKMSIKAHKSMIRLVKADYKNNN